ncbi:hypothetical protein KUTeg_008033 [Tegillarca granosa]|uniref:Uncharacterized protein n=1 Tax=Tegillarca granosa TaxID=220873 RepID=A0ABQ9FDP6_TEGGR|nr:hypothetical protein KUTeg_008033 [Tegillarca granosa]
MAKRFEGKTALVTGGSRRIGKAVAERLLQEGAKIDVSDWDRTKTAVEQIGVVDLLDTAYRFEGKKALVTGGSRGIGKAIAERLLLEGAKVYVIGRSQENLEKIKTEIPSLNTIQVDVTNWDETKTAVEQIGVVDLLVNNAGILDQANFVDVEMDKFDKMIETNCKSASI